MPEPVPQHVTRNFSFTDYQALQPTVPLPGQSVDNEYDRSNNTINDVIDFVRQAINDEGMIRPEAAGSAIGPQGPQGDPGIQGPLGPQGEPGVDGAIGVNGPQGVMGPAGESYQPDALGPLSDRPTYDAEPKNFGFLDTEAGILYFKLSNAPGDWSTGTPFARGPTGPQGLQGLQGPQGQQGVQGVQGIQGLPGQAGADGAPGATGPQGVPGVPGNAGPPGVQGPDGDPGAVGPQGPQGVPGPTGPAGGYADINALVNKVTPVDADIQRLQSAPDAFGDRKVTFLQQWTNYFKPKADALYLLITRIATVAQFRANTVDKLLETDVVWGAAVEVAVPYAAAVTLDFSTGINWALAPLTGPVTINTPTNMKPGQSGVIRLLQDGTGNRLATFGSGWKFTNNVPPILTSTANAEDLLFYHVLSATRVFGGLAKAIPA